MSPQQQQQRKYNKLAGKHVLIIGGTSGIGYAVAEASIESSAHVTISSSSSTRVTTAVEKLKSLYPNATNIRGFPCDLSQDTVEKDIETLFSQVGKVDHIVYTAGDKLATIPIQEATLENITAAGQLRFFAPLLVAKVGSRYLNPGPESSIVFTTGCVSEKPLPSWSVVASYAAGLHGMTRNLALDLRPVRVNLVSPGPTDTELWKDLSADEKEGLFVEKHLTGRVGRPEDVAEAYLWLMKDPNVTGTVVSSDSGIKLV